MSLLSPAQSAALVPAAAATLPDPATLAAAPVAASQPVVQSGPVAEPQVGTGLVADATGDTNGAATPSAPAQAPELTPRQKAEKRVQDLTAHIAAKTEELARAQAALNNIDQLALIVPGVGVKATVGRAKTKREVVASVIAVEDGRVSIFFGSGLKSETAVIRIEDITEVLQAAAA